MYKAEGKNALLLCLNHIGFLKNTEVNPFKVKKYNHSLDRGYHLQVYLHLPEYCNLYIQTM